MPCQQPPQLRPPCALRAPPPPDALPPPRRACRSSSYAPLPDSAVRFDVQPAAELRHVQRHKHEKHVFGATRVPCTQPPQLGPPSTLLAPPPHPHPPASRLACRSSSDASLLNWQQATAFNQPLSFDTSKVTNMYGMLDVRSARALPQQAPQLGRAGTLLAPPPPHALPPPISHLAPFPMLSF